MTQNEKAVANLGSYDIAAQVIRDVVYVIIGGSHLELSDYEVGFQADVYDKKQE